ncbi:MAG TPA: RNA 2',3'-cyclic phosphodiesterase [Bryobacteraceae bacterium]|jgi:2'-5' RNA ligase
MIQPNPQLRLFIGIALPSDINSSLDQLVKQLKPLAAIRWSPTANFHVTTKFIGAWPQERMEELKSTLASTAGSGAFAIAIRGLGFFPNAKRPRVFWAGVEGGEPLSRLASQTDQACARLGVEPEARAYSPHLTLARIDSPSRLGPLHVALSKLPSVEFGEFHVGVFHLYRSQAGRGGSVYTSLAEFPL